MRARRVDVGVGYANDLQYSGPSGLNEALAEFLTGVRMLEHNFTIAGAPSLEHGAYCKTVGGQTGAVVNADGVLYSCWESAGKPGWEVGDVGTGYFDDARLTERWVSCDYDRVGPSQAEMDRFFNRVEAAILDWQFEHDRL
jgi:uncharacterized protein